MNIRTLALLSAMASLGLPAVAHADSKYSNESEAAAKAAEAAKEADAREQNDEERAKAREESKRAAEEKAAKAEKVKALREQKEKEKNRSPEEAKRAAEEKAAKLAEWKKEVRNNPELAKKLAEEHKEKLAKLAELEKENGGKKPGARLPFDVRFESEKPGLQNTTATFKVGGVETFDKRDTGEGQDFKTDFGTDGTIVGVYRNVTLLSQDQYGGANGEGNYAVTFADKGYSLDLSSKFEGGVNYFGYWLSALDSGNTVTFYSKGEKLFTFNPDDVINALKQTKEPELYYGNPNEKFRGENKGEPYVFVNFFNDKGSFDRVEFAENPMVGGYESDNHTVGYFLTKGTGTQVNLGGAGAVPEPASWAMLIAGFGLVGASARRRRLVAA
ncbi:MAG: hypothetical protein RL490_440 [Pseudomonadota bacterium]